MNWWEKEPLRIFEIANAFVDPGAEGPAREAEDVYEIGANLQHLFCMRQEGGLNERKLCFESRVAKAVNRDYLKKYLPEAHKRGLKIIIYFNVHWHTKEFGQEHPHWLQIKEDGKPIDDVYTTGTSFCVNSPWREWVFQIVKDLGKYDIDGIFLDGPIFFANTCYCPSCEDLFQEKYKYPLPSKSRKENASWKDLVEFQSDSLAKFLKDSRQVLREGRPSALFYMNGNSYWPSWPTGRDNRKIIQYTDETSLYDEYGKRLPDFQLSRILEIHFAGQVLGPMGWDYIAGRNNNSLLLEGITRKYLPAPAYGIKIEARGAQEILSFCERLKGRYDGIPALSRHPFLLTNTYGKGKALSLAGTYGEMLYKFHFQEYYRIIGNAANLLSRPLINLKNAPSSLEIILRQKENKLFIHLINFTSEMKRPLERIIPLKDIKVHLRPSLSPLRIKALWANKELTFENNFRGSVFTIPLINEYEVVIVEEKR